MMQVPVYDINGNKIKEIELPPHFEEEIRPDLIKRAVLAIYSHKRQPYGVYEYAGLEASAWTSKRRRTWRTSYGRGISRVPRAIMLRSGGLFIWTARLVPHAVKGRRAHPPKPEKIWYEKINKKEKRKAIRSAIAATANKYFLIKRHQKASKIIEDLLKIYELPIILTSEIEEIDKTRELKTVFKNIGIYSFIEYVKETKRQRAGKGKRRGRRLVMNRGLLVVIGDEDSNVTKVNMEGLEIVPVNKLNAEVLAPGAKPGRFTVWTENAIENLRNLFI